MFTLKPFSFCFCFCFKLKSPYSSTTTRQALLACLEPAELTKVYQLKSAHAIWKRLAHEYGPISDFRRAQVLSEFYALRKESSVSMQEYINEFTSLQQEVDYHRSNISPLTNDEINLTFLKSLGDDWQIFQQSIGPRLHGMSPPQLFGEVLVFDSKTHRSIPATKDPLALSSRFQKRLSNAMLFDKQIPQLAFDSSNLPLQISHTLLQSRNLLHSSALPCPLNHIVH